MITTSYPLPIDFPVHTVAYSQHYFKKMRVEPTKSACKIKLQQMRDEQAKSDFWRINFQASKAPSWRNNITICVKAGYLYQAL